MLVGDEKLWIDDISKVGIPIFHKVHIEIRRVL